MDLTKMFKKEREEILSLDIGSRAAKIALISLSKGKTELLKYAIKEFGAEELQHEDRILREFIIDFIRTNSILQKEIMITLQDPDSLIIKRVSLPSVPENETREALSWEIKNDIPFDLGRAQIDWQTIDEYTDTEGAKRKDLMLACAKNELVERYLNIAKGIGLNVIDIKSPPFDLAYILERIEGAKEGAVAVLDVGAIGSNFSIYKNSKLSFIRALPFSSEAITTSMSGTILSDTGRIELTKEKADEIKKEFGIPHDPNQVLVDGIKAIQIISLIRPILERLVSEIKRSIDYCVASYEAEAPKVMYIIGGGSNLKGLKEYLKEELAFDVYNLRSGDFISINETLKRDQFDSDSAQLINVLSAGLSLQKRPSLLPYEYRTEKAESFQKMSLRLVTITAAALFVFSLIAVRAQVADYKNRVKNAKMHLGIIDKINEINEKIIERGALIAEIKADRIPPGWILKELCNLVPAAGLLDGIVIDRKDDILILTGHIICKKQDAQDELSAFMKALEESCLFDEAILRSSNRTLCQGRDASKFEIRCELADWDGAGWK